jgi:DNA-binding transcriptional ArsR family regulator
MQVPHLVATATEPLTLGELTDQLDVGQSTVSHQRAKLAAVGFVDVERVGTPADGASIPTASAKSRRPLS